MHVHLSYAKDVATTLTSCLEWGSIEAKKQDQSQRPTLYTAAMTTTPEEYDELCEALSLALLEVKHIRPQEHVPRIYPALGFHPWSVSDEPTCVEKRLAAFAELLRSNNSCDTSQTKSVSPRIDRTHLIGEIGLDASKRFLDPKTQMLQEQVFLQICEIIANATDQIANQTSDPLSDEVCKKPIEKAVDNTTKNTAIYASINQRFVLSIHAVHAAHKALKILQDHELTSRAICIFHHFSGSHTELHELMEAGCYCSVGRRFFTTRRSKEYIKLMQPTRILLETDYPLKQGDPLLADTLVDELILTLQQIEQAHPGAAENILKSSQHIWNILGARGTV